MKVEFAKAFVRDLRKIKTPNIRKRLGETIVTVEQARALSDIRDIKKLRYGTNCYRIRVGDFRIGAVLEGETIVLMRFLHRRDLYRYFPAAAH